MYGLVFVFVGLGLILLGWELSIRRDERRRKQIPSLAWYQFTDCHLDTETGIVTARGVLALGNVSPSELRPELRPPFEIQISANGSDIDMVVCDISTTMGSSEIVWHAQDKASYVSSHRFP